MTGKEEELEDRRDDFTPTDELGPVDLGGEFDADTLAAIAGDDDGADDGQEAEKPVEKEGGKGDDKESVIPRARFDEVNAGKKAAEEELQRLRKLLEEKGGAQDEAGDKDKGEDQPKQEENQGDPTLDKLKADLRALRAKARDALLEGNIEDHDLLTEQADELTQEIAEERIRQSQSKERAQAQVAEALGTVAKAAFDLYPFLDTSSDTADIDAINAVRSRRFELESQGKSPAEALQIAVDEKGPKFAKLNGVEVNQEAADKVRADRERKAREKSANASLSQPSLPASGSGEPKLKVDIDKMSDSEYARLPESVKARLRGDVL